MAYKALYKHFQGGTEYKIGDIIDQLPEGADASYFEEVNVNKKEAKEAVAKVSKAPLKGRKKSKK